MKQIKAAAVNIHDSWRTVLKDEFEQAYFAEIKQFLKSQYQAGKRIYPPGKLMFNAFDQTPFDKVRVVILGQDPYHGPGQAMGLSFSVPYGVRVPASLKNIYKEMHEDVGASIAEHGDLTSWAQQGVLLLNAILTVEHKQPGSHKKIGWQRFTDAVIRIISEQRDGIVFMLWGNFAQSKQELIDFDRHFVLTAAHPSPLARGAYFGSRHFSQANTHLVSRGEEPINWQL